MKREHVGYRLFKAAYKGRDGSRREAAAWYVEFNDQRGKVRRLPAFANRKASDEMGRNLVTLVSYFNASGGQIDPALGPWLTALPAHTRNKLAEIGLIPAERAGAGKPLAEHLEDWRRAMLAKGTTERHADLVTGRARRTLDGCGFTYFGDIRASKVAEYLDGLRGDTETARGISAQTFNFYLAAIKGFCRWAVRDRRTSENPVGHLTGLNVRTDRRHDRRALAADELRKLLAKTGKGPERFGMSGAARTMLYRVAVETGLRAHELSTLTRASFTLDGPEPSVTVSAAYSKHRREDVLPLLPALAAELREFTATLAPAAAVFPMPRSEYVVKMFREDLEAAGIAPVDDAGRFADFHALRHTFISNLAAGGVHPKLAQALARHSTITLTMDRYSHVVRGDTAAGLGVLPDLSGPACERAKATGTDNARAIPPDADPRLAECLAQIRTRSPILLDLGGHAVSSPHGSDTPGIEGKNANSPGKKALGSVRAPGGRRGLQNR